MKTLLTKLKTWLTIAVLGATVYAGGFIDGEPMQQGNDHTKRHISIK